jgi:hypothetical protein
MPSKSDIQFGKLAITSHFAAKDEVENSLKDQGRFERERHTAILEAVLLQRKCLNLEQVEAIQKRMKRRVIFCSKCFGKFNVFQFRGGENFLCHKCGNRVNVPDGPEYRILLEGLAKKVGEFLAGKGSPEAPAPAPEPAKAAERDTIMVSAKDIERARASRAPKPAARDELLEPVAEKAEPAGPPPAEAPAAEAPAPETPAEEEIEGEVEAEIEAEPVEEEAASSPPAEEAASSPPAEEAAPSTAEKKEVRKFKIKKLKPADAPEAAPAVEEAPKDEGARPEVKKKFKFEGKLKRKPKA